MRKQFKAPLQKRIPPLAKSIASKSLSTLTNHLSLWHQVLRDNTILDRARNRMVVGIMLFAAAFALIGVRLIDVMVFRGTSERQEIQEEKQESLVLERSDIVDRNGEILATHLITASVYANPKVILNAKEAADKLCTLMPEVDYDTTLKRLQSDKGFVWLTRHIPPKLQYEVNKLGIPGIYLQKDQRRVYPYGNMVSHVIGCCGIDNIGLSGVEKYFDVKLRKEKKPLALSLDVRAQHIVHDELKAAIQEFKALAGNAMLMDLGTGEMLAMVSLPDFDPNQPNLNAQDAIFNRNTLGVYEPGSTFKIFNTTFALETGRIGLNTVYDATNPLKVGRFTINDFKGKHRPLTVTETFIYSSNIASAKMAQEFGLNWQQKFFAKFGLHSKPHLEIPEIGAPIVQKHPTEATLISNSFGYAISVSPLQTFRGIAAIVNDGYFRELTLVKGSTPVAAEPIISKKTSQSIKKLMRLVAVEGTGKKADVQGYPVLAKTGSAHKARRGSYDMNAKITSCIAAFPANDPKYLLMVVLDAPQATETTYGYSTGGWNAAPTAGKMIARIAPMMSLTPDFSYNDTPSSELKTISHDIHD